MVDYSPDRGMENAVVRLAVAIDKLADSLDHMAVASQANGVSLGQVTGRPASAGPPNVVAPAVEKTLQQKMAGKVYAICMKNGWDIADIGQRCTGRPMDSNSRKWSEDDLKIVLDTDWFA